MVATFPLLNPLIRCPAIKSNAPGTSSTTLINSLVDSVTDNSTGDYTVNLTNAMSSTNYSATGTSIDIGSYYLATTGRVTFSTSSYELNCCDSGFNVRDPDDASNISFGDLA